MSGPMSELDALAGLLRLRPGRPPPYNLRSSRPDWAERLCAGRPAADVPGLLAGIFSLCGSAQRLCAELALQAAAGRDSEGVEAAQLLRREPLREHVRRIGLDWVERLALPQARAELNAASLGALQDCPLFAAPLGDAPAALGAWLEQRLLGLPAAQWLAGWERDAQDWLALWSATFPGWLPRLLRDCRWTAEAPIAGAPPLLVHADPASLRWLAAQLREDAGFVRRPRWQGRCAETGSWTRLRQPALDCATPWLRLGARLAELCRLSLADDATRLDHGALAIAPGEGLAWVEMARGLLVHHVQLGDEVRQPHMRSVAHYRVLAPTEWNFHPMGAVAAALAGLPSDDAAATRAPLAALLCAYDPCVRYEVEPASTRAPGRAEDEELIHA